MWELVFLMFVMKIPIVYLCLVVWWAVRAEPAPPELAPALAAERPNAWTPPALRASSRRRRPDRPHGRPPRRPSGSPLATRATSRS